MGLADRVVVATDAAEVMNVAAREFEVVLTSPEHRSGTDRVAEVATMPGYTDFDIVVNVQGDEPFLPRAALAGAVERVRGGDDVGTAAAPLRLSELADPGRVKVVCDLAGRALYFSRSVIPHWRENGAAPAGLYWQHLGLYAFRRPALVRWSRLAPTPLEEAERLEQLRALQHGFTIGVALLTEPAPAGIDTPDDLRQAERYWHTEGGRA
jgi:3-deoxy-manno-octulosonate cytidylyltransferase (CMP-KDO synthetase)